MSKNMKNDFDQKFININSKKGKFWEVEEKLEIFGFPKYVKNILLAEHGLEGKLKDNVLFCLHYLEVIKKKEETQSNIA